MVSATDELRQGLPPKEEAAFQAWARDRGPDFQQEALAFYQRQSPWYTLVSLFIKATQLLSPVFQKEKELASGEGLLLLLQTMVALLHENGFRPYTLAELNRRTPLQDALTLFRLEVLPLEVAARVAGVSQRVFLDALGEAGISP